MAKKTTTKSKSGADVYRSKSRKKELAKITPGNNKTPTEDKMREALDKAVKDKKISPKRAGNTKGKIYLEGLSVTAKARKEEERKKEAARKAATKKKKAKAKAKK